MDSGGQVSVLLSPFLPFGLYPEMGVLDHMVHLCLILGGIAGLFPTVAAPFPIPASRAQVSGFSTSSWTPVSLCLFLPAAVLLGVRRW